MSQSNPHRLTSADVDHFDLMDFLDKVLDDLYPTDRDELEQAILSDLWRSPHPLDGTSPRALTTNHGDK